MLMNLISNSIKFTDKGHVKVKVRVKNSYADITVEDTGIVRSHAPVNTTGDQTGRNRETFPEVQLQERGKQPERNRTWAVHL